MINFKKEFESHLNDLYPNGLEWGVVGILTQDQRVYTLSYDSKILSGIFEIFCEPIVKKIADSNNLKFEKASQTVYPDFTLFSEDESKRKIAVEVKSTYRKYKKDGSIKKYGFTLGSYKSFLRDPKGKKNILYPYSEYIQHLIIGFVYDRNPDCDLTEIKQVIEAANLQTPFINIDYFVQDKYKIAGKSPGSGNTTNIGSIKSNDIQDFKNGSLGFSSQTKFDNYWKNY